MPRRQVRRQEPGKVLEKIGEFLRGDGVADPNVEAYLGRLERDWAGLRTWLPLARDCKAFLDIGCGLGGHAALLAAHYPRAVPNLLDGKENREKGPNDGGFHAQGEPWVNVYRAARMVSYCCGSESLTWTYPEVLDTGMLSCDLIVSFRAWGHHFPAGVYLPLVARSLTPGGIVVLDIRNGTDGLTQFTSSDQFKLLGEIEQQSTKCRRLVLEKVV